MYYIHTAIWQAGGGASPELFEELCQKAARRCPRLRDGWEVEDFGAGFCASFQLV